MMTPRHGRFLIAFGFGALVGLAAWAQGISLVFSALTAADAFFVLYLAMMVALVRSSGPDELRKHADQSDEGVALILMLAAVAVAVSVTAIYLVLNEPLASLAARWAALITLPLGWATIHTLASFHYAYLYYREANHGLVFPGKAEPGAWEFMYFSFTIGMTAQISDVVATSQTMRKAILLHGIASFFYNTGILALAVNAVVTGGG